MTHAKNHSIPGSAAIAVFGDVHGRVSLMLALCQMWQYHTGRRLDAILQVGDMGAYPDHTRLDKATLKHAKRDKDELGFVDYCQESHEGRFFLGDDLLPDTFFIRGNHEDFEYLSYFQRPAAVDPWQKITYIPDGKVVTLDIDDWSLRIGGMGGVPPKVEERGQGRVQREMFRDSLRKAELQPKRFTPRDIERAFARELEPIDILLTHAGPRNVAFERGSILLEGLSERVKPRFHFFGHHHVVVPPTLVSHDRTIVGLDHLDFYNKGALSQDAWGILEISPTDADFTFANDQTMPWLRTIRHKNYRQMARSLKAA